jgi:dolichyl-phosphate-mannose--protein O-mannosyl transferase
MWFVLSRIAVNEIYATVCIVGGAYAAYRYFADGEEPRHLLVAGATFGLGLAMKWSVGPLFAVCLVLTLARILTRAASTRSLRVAPLAAWTVGFLALPGLIYLASYLPYFAAGHSFRDFVELGRVIVYYHSEVKVEPTHPLASRWYEWPLDIKPMPMLSEHYGGRYHVIYGMGNPAVWWLLLPATVWTAVRFLRHRRLEDGYVLLGIVTGWLPWAFVRRVTFIRYLMPAIPFVIMAIVTMLGDLERWWGARRPRLPILAGHAALSVALFVYFYPIWSAAPIPHGVMPRWLWFAAWR